MTLDPGRELDAKVAPRADDGERLADFLAVREAERVLEEERWAERAIDSDVRSAEVVQVVKVVFTRGTGWRGSTFREVTQYRTLEGELIAELDPVAAMEAEQSW